MKRIVHHAKKQAKRLKELRVINNLLTIMVTGLGLYIILAPLLPQVMWWVREASPLQALANQSDGVEQAADGTIGSDRLFIPSIGLEAVILEGGPEQLSKGILRRGQTSTPDQGGNTVLAGHRFTYDDRGVFYHLDKLKPGDPIAVHWFPERYDYEVTEVFVVQAEDIWVEDSTSEDILTLYTCTPLWNPKDRLVVRAKLVEDL